MVSHHRTRGTWKVGEKVDGSWTVSILLDEAAMVLSPRSRVDCCPAMLTVVTQAVDITTEVGSILTTTVESVTLITDLVI